MTTAIFYPLTTERFLDVNPLLSDAQMRVYMYWKTLDPFGNRTIAICTKAIADALGLVQRTVQLALNKLSSVKLIKWDKTHGLVSKFGDRQRDPMIAKANVGSPRRTEDRERQLELNLEADSGTPKIINIIKINNLDQEEIFDFQDTGNSEITIDGHNENSEMSNENCEMSLEDAIALVRSELCNESDELCNESDELCNESNELCNESNELNAQSDLEPDIKYDLVPEKPKTELKVDSPRRRVEDFVLKTLNKSFPTEARRAAYFSRFDAKSWKKWETDYKASLTPIASTRNQALEDPWRMVTAIESAMKAKDLDYAIFRLETLREVDPELAVKTQERLGIKS